MRQALILAAGRGRRLGETSRGRPKCLLTVGGRTLVQHQLAALSDVGVEEVCLVTGYGADQVSAHLDGRCRLLLNSRWGETNSIYSLWLARDWVRGELFVLNSDVLAHPEVFRRVVCAAGSALAYDSSSGSEDEHMKVSVAGGELHAISKGLPPERTSGENVGMLRFERSAAHRLMREAGALVTGGHADAWAVAALDRLVPDLAVRCVDVADLPWIEIDSDGDLRAARDAVWPAIRGTRRAYPAAPADLSARMSS